MTAQGPTDLPGPWPDVLAAYADGELDPSARAVVEQWLASNPVARDELRTQRQLSPDNWRLWQKTEPQLPSEAAWSAVLESISLAATPEPATPSTHYPPHLPGQGRSRWERAGRWLAVGVAATTVVIGLVALRQGQERPAPPHQEQRTPEVVEFHPSDPLAGMGILPLASNEDVDICRVGASEDGWLPVGVVPLSGPLVLAGVDDIALDGAAPDPAWPSGSPQITRGPGEAPMIFAANPR